MVFDTVRYIDSLKKVSVAIAILRADFVEEFQCNLEVFLVLVTFGFVS